MRYFVLGLSMAFLAILHQRDALAEQGPIFECPKARKAAERAICDDPFSILMDREIARQFGALRSTHPGIVADQMNWLKKRDQCQDDRACLWTALASRWVALGRRIEEDLGISRFSGVYDYVARPEEIAGDLTLAAGPGGQYGFFISTVTLRQGHLCEIMGANANPTEAGEIEWRIPETDRRLIISPGDAGFVTVAIEYDDERNFCGARAYLHGPYRMTAEDQN